MNTPSIDIKLFLDYFVGIVFLKKTIAGHIAGTTLYSEFVLNVV